MGWHVTGSAEVAGAVPFAGVGGGSSCRPTVSHDLDPKSCLKCENPRKDQSVLCAACIEQGKQAARDSLRRQAKAGMKPGNWQPGDPFWWKASGCYGKE